MREWIRSIVWALRPERPGDPHEDFSKRPPFGICFDGPVESKPPERLFRKKRFRVGLFPETGGRTCDCCGRALRWLVLEFLDDRKRWQHLLTLHETNFPVMLDVLSDVTAHLGRLTDEAERSRTPRD